MHLANNYNLQENEGALRVPCLWDHMPEEIPTIKIVTVESWLLEPSIFQNSR